MLRCILSKIFHNLYLIDLPNSYKKRDFPQTYRNNKVINKFLKETTYLLSGKIFFREKALFSKKSSSRLLLYIILRKVY
ncbi:hypothetical protein DW103_12210 [Parabacteroides sp. AM08-6]|nr:hypothetical protein DW103_12210 [Parabacteroides sp. AM08-6]